MRKLTPHLYILDKLEYRFWREFNYEPLNRPTMGKVNKLLRLAVEYRYMELVGGKLPTNIEVYEVIGVDPVAFYRLDRNAKWSQWLDRAREILRDDVAYGAWVPSGAPVMPRWTSGVFEGQMSLEFWG